MIFFLRALQLSLRYKWSIAGAVVSSVVIAVLFSVSLTTVYPLVTVISTEHKTIPDWFDDRLAQYDIEIAKLQNEVSALEAKPNESDASQLQKRRTDLVSEHRAQAWTLWLKPYVDRYSPRTPFTTIVFVMVWLLVISALKGVFLVLSVILVSRVANRTIWDMRRIYFRKALELDQRRIDQIGTANLMTQLAHNIQMISAALGMFYGKMLREPLKMLTCLIGAAMISWKLLLISLLVIPFGAFLVHNISRRMKRASLKEVTGMGDVYQTLMETFSSIKTVRIFNREQTERVRFKENSGTLYRISQRISLYDSILRPVGEMLGIISISLATLAGAYLVLSGQTDLFGIPICKKPMSASSLMMFYALLAGASDPARKMSEILNVLVRGGTACESLFKMFDQTPAESTNYDPTIKVPFHQQQIEFDNVSFCFQENHKVLKQIRLTIPFGQSVAIVGGNGAGKTTLVNLLARFYDPSEGRILIDGVDLTKLNPKKLRRQMAWVTQDSVLFKGTVRANIMYGTRACSEEQFLKAAALARVDEFVGELPQGYDTNVGDGGGRLSAGQRQRVALARAIVANPRILILDEATSQLDGHTEQLVHDSLRPYLAERTTILITHRHTSLKLTDRVIVMDRGKIVSDTSTDSAAKDSADFRSLFAKSA